MHSAPAFACNDKRHSAIRASFVGLGDEIQKRYDLDAALIPFLWNSPEERLIQRLWRTAMNAVLARSNYDVWTEGAEFSSKAPLGVHLQV